MRVAYLDSSALIGLAFDEPKALSIANRLRAFDRLESSNLLEAEFRAACRREGVTFNAQSLEDIACEPPQPGQAARGSPRKTSLRCHRTNCGSGRKWGACGGRSG